MSVTFHRRMQEVDLEDQSTYLNLCNTNARDLLIWLGVKNSDELCGEMPASDLAVLCRRRLWNESRNHDPQKETVISGGLNTGKVLLIECGRDADYLRRRTSELLKLCETPNLNDSICWG